MNRTVTTASIATTIMLIGPSSRSHAYTKHSIRQRGLDWEKGNKLLADNYAVKRNCSHTTNSKISKATISIDEDGMVWCPRLLPSQKPLLIGII